MGKCDEVLLDYEKLIIISTHAYPQYGEIELMPNDILTVKQNTCE